MLRPLLVIPLLILAAALMGAAGCRLNGAAWHPRELMVASAIALLAAEVPVALVVRQRGPTAVQMAQTAVQALGLQLLLSLVLAAAAGLSRQVGPAFTWWMLAMFWVTLFGMCGVLVRAMRAAAGAKPSAAATPTRAAQ